MVGGAKTQNSVAVTAPSRRSLRCPVMSAFGPKRTRRARVFVSAFGVIADTGN
jgi:hypothetical protein